MKKSFKALSILVASAALGGSIAMASGCTGGNGTYEGSYSYNNWGQTYGMSVKVTVENNIITKVEDTTKELHADWHSVSAGWEDYYASNSWLWTEYDVKSTVDRVVDYTIVTKKGSDIKTDLELNDVNNFRPNPFTFNIKVKEDGTIAEFKIDENGSTAETYTNRMPESFLDGTWFVGKKTEDILEAFGGDIGYDKDYSTRTDPVTEGNINTGLTSNELSTGASQSDFVCLQAAAFASSNAEAIYNNPGTKLSAEMEYADVINIDSSSVVVHGKVPSKDLPEPKDTAINSYGWTNDMAANWTNSEAWLLQMYEGWSVADVLDIKVFVKASGEPYEVKDTNNNSRNDQLDASGLLVSGATQGSGRLLLAIQDALTK